MIAWRPRMLYVVHAWAIGLCLDAVAMGSRRCECDIYCVNCMRCMPVAMAWCLPLESRAWVLAQIFTLGIYVKMKCNAERAALEDELQLMETPIIA
eukprot:3116633-Amphidinium_carterae.1